MQILLVNTNPVVSRLISLITNSTNIHVDEITGYEPVPQERYDILFMDEDCCHEEEIRMFLNKVRARKKILFSSRKEKRVEGVDGIIVKPFLPSEISRVIETLPERPDEMPDAEHVTTAGIEPVDRVDERKRGQEAESSILDSIEIEKIKQLLAEEGLEIAENEEYDVDEELMIEDQKQKKQKKSKKKKKQKVSRKTKKREAKFEANLLEAVTMMKPKKNRKLLKGSEVNISIKFPKGD
jgi:DNA-binding response OmpR family regulator